jgi:hypothetical protein
MTEVIDTTSTLAIVVPAQAGIHIPLARKDADSGAASDRRTETGSPAPKTYFRPARGVLTPALRGERLVTVCRSTAPPGRGLF